MSDRRLILGGIHIPHELGLLGHSDADVLTHAIMDAMLGALSLGDIGHYFPPSDPQWAGADSLVLLTQVHQLIRDQGWQIGNIDSVVVAERPKLKPHISKMRDKLAAVLEVEPNQIGIKATTNEKLGPDWQRRRYLCLCCSLTIAGITMAGCQIKVQKEQIFYVKKMKISLSFC